MRVPLAPAWSAALAAPTFVALAASLFAAWTASRFVPLAVPLLWKPADGMPVSSWQLAGMVRPASLGSNRRPCPVSVAVPLAVSAMFATWYGWAAYVAQYGSAALRTDQSNRLEQSDWAEQQVQHVPLPR